MEHSSCDLYANSDKSYNWNVDWLELGIALDLLEIRYFLETAAVG
ncbi:hypothetical protein FBZ93_13114, partial [Bradyrhizobium macuxiense]